MGFFTKLQAAVERNHSLLCVGLDPNPAQAPARYRAADGNPAATIVAWNRAIIAQTQDLVCAYKPNIAFYEALGASGMAALRQTLALIPPHIPVLLDAKRGDIGSTAEAYARACFDDLGVDGVTLSPYLGKDSIEPFARYADKGLFVLCHTSNPGAGEFQELEIADWRTLDREPNQPLYIHVARTATAWSPNVGLVVGATFPQAIADVRSAAPQAWFLVPGHRRPRRRSGSDAWRRVSAPTVRVSSSTPAATLPWPTITSRQPRKLRDEINAVRAQLRAQGTAKPAGDAKPAAVRRRSCRRLAIFSSWPPSCFTWVRSSLAALRLPAVSSRPSM